MDNIDIIEWLPEYLEANELNNLRIQVALSEDKQTYFAKLDELEIDQAARDLKEDLKKYFKEIPSPNFSPIG